jgi:hypothetical protein
MVFTKSKVINYKGSKFDKDNTVRIYGKSSNDMFDPNRTMRGVVLVRTRAIRTVRITVKITEEWEGS